MTCVFLAPIFRSFNFERLLDVFSIKNRRSSKKMQKNAFFSSFLYFFSFWGTNHYNNKRCARARMLLLGDKIGFSI